MNMQNDNFSEAFKKLQSRKFTNTEIMFSNDIIPHQVTRTIDDNAIKEIQEKTKLKEKRESENNEAIKDISDLVRTLEKSNKANNKISNIMFALTIVTAVATIAQVFIAIFKK